MNDVMVIKVHVRIAKENICISLSKMFLKECQLAPVVKLKECNKRHTSHSCSFGAPEVNTTSLWPREVQDHSQGAQSTTQGRYLTPSTSARRTSPSIRGLEFDPVWDRVISSEKRNPTKHLTSRNTFSQLITSSWQLTTTGGTCWKISYNFGD